MKRTIRLSPNEEARLLKNEFDALRIQRLKQVREQSKQRAIAIREAVQNESKRQIRKLTKKVEAELSVVQDEKLRRLESEYHSTIKLVGEAHISAVNHPPVEEERKALVEINEKNAIERNKAAQEKLQQENKTKYLRENRHILNRFGAIAIERKRANHIASLPPRPPDPVTQITHKRALRPVGVTDAKAFSSTHYHVPEKCLVEKNDNIEETLDAHTSAIKETENMEMVAKSKAQNDQTIKEKARLRHIAARKRELLKQDYNEMLHDLSDLQRADKQRRQKDLSSIPKLIFLPPDARRFAKDEKQRKIESKFNSALVRNPDTVPEEVKCPNKPVDVDEEERKINVDSNKGKGQVFSNLLEKIKEQQVHWSLQTSKDDQMSPMTQCLFNKENAPPSPDLAGVDVKAAETQAEKYNCDPLPNKSVMNDASTAKQSEDGVCLTSEHNEKLYDNNTSTLNKVISTNELMLLYYKPEISSADEIQKSVQRQPNYNKEDVETGKDIPDVERDRSRIRQIYLNDFSLDSSRLLNREPRSSDKTLGKGTNNYSCEITNKRCLNINYDEIPVTEANTYNGLIIDEIRRDINYSENIFTSVDTPKLLPKSNVGVDNDINEDDLDIAISENEDRPPINGKLFSMNSYIPHELSRIVERESSESIQSDSNASDKSDGYYKSFNLALSDSDWTGSKSSEKSLSPSSIPIISKTVVTKSSSPTYVSTYSSQNYLYTNLLKPLSLDNMSSVTNSSTQTVSDEELPVVRKLFHTSKCVQTSPPSSLISQSSLSTRSTTSRDFTDCPLSSSSNELYTKERAKETLKTSLLPGNNMSQNIPGHNREIYPLYFDAMTAEDGSNLGSSNGPNLQPMTEDGDNLRIFSQCPDIRKQKFSAKIQKQSPRTADQPDELKFHMTSDTYEPSHDSSSLSSQASSDTWASVLQRDCQRDISIELTGNKSSNDDAQIVTKELTANQNLNKSIPKMKPSQFEPIFIGLSPSYHTFLASSSPAKLKQELNPTQDYQPYLTKDPLNDLKVKNGPVVKSENVHIGFSPMYVSFSASPRKTPLNSPRKTPLNSPRATKTSYQNRKKGVLLSNKTPDKYAQSFSSQSDSTSYHSLPDDIQTFADKNYLSSPQKSRRNICKSLWRNVTDDNAKISQVHKEINLKVDSRQFSKSSNSKNILTAAVSAVKKTLESPIVKSHNPDIKFLRKSARRKSRRTSRPLLSKYGIGSSTKKNKNKQMKDEPKNVDWVSSLRTTPKMTPTPRKKSQLSTKSVGLNIKSSKPSSAISKVKLSEVDKTPVKRDKQIFKDIPKKRIQFTDYPKQIIQFTAPENILNSSIWNNKGIMDESMPLVDLYDDEPSILEPKAIKRSISNTDDLSQSLMSFIALEKECDIEDKCFGK